MAPKSKPRKGRPPIDGRVIRAAAGIELLSLLDERGTDTSALIAKTGLPREAFADPDNLIPLVALGSLFADAARLTGLSSVGLAVGSRMGFDGLGLVGYLLANAETLGGGLQMLTRFLQVNTNAVVPYLRREDAVGVVGYEPFGGRTPGDDQMMFGAIAILTNAMRKLCAPGFKLHLVTFAYGAPADHHAFRRFFRAPVAFNGTRNAIAFDAGWLDHPIAGADPTLRRLIERQIRLLKPPRDRPATVQQMRSVIRTMLLAGPVTEAQAARAFQMHRRTFARRLQDAGTTFQEQLDDARSELARSLLEGSGAPISEIAVKLGFRTTAGFTRAFQRWEGMSPTRWRRASKAA